MASRVQDWLETEPPQSETGDWEWYPSHGDPPLTDTELQRLEREALYWVLARHFHANETVYVGADMFVYYEQGERDKKVSPDLFLCFGLPRTMYRVFKTWEEAHGLDWVLEIVSKGTWRNDLGKKRRLYAADLGVQEYFVYDPEGVYLKEPLLGFSRKNGRLRPMKPIAQGHYRSALLGLDLMVRPYERPIGKWRMDFYKLGGIPLLRSDEALELQERAWAQETVARAQETAAREAAEAENRSLREELERLRANKSP